MNSYDLKFYDDVLKKFNNINILLDSVGDIRACGKFFWCNNYNNNFYICDDDIIYPNNYKSECSKYINNNYKCIYSSLGVKFKKYIKNFPIGKERLFSNKFTESNKILKNVDLIGTGVCFFRALQNNFPDFNYLLKHVTFNDDLLSCWAKQNNISLYLIPKKDKWLISTKKMIIGLYEEKNVDNITLNKVLNLFISNNPW